MRPLVVDTNIWVEWLRGREREMRELSRERIVLMPAVVALELLSGARERRSYRIVRELISSFERHRRLILPTREDFIASGETFADLGWSAGAKTNDSLIVTCARRVGAEVLTRDISDLGPLAKLFSVNLV